MRYLIEEFRGDDGVYHLQNCRIVETDKYIEEKHYFKGESTFYITKLDDEVQTKRRTSRKEKRDG